MDEARDGATLAKIMEATGWQAHMVRVSRGASGPVGRPVVLNGGRVLRAGNGQPRGIVRTGRVGGVVEPFAEFSQSPSVLALPPRPDRVAAYDNGDGSLTVVAGGAFRNPARVRIGGSVQSTAAGTAGFEQNDRQIRFVAPAIDLATKGAFILNTDGLEWSAVPEVPLPKPGCPDQAFTLMTLPGLSRSLSPEGSGKKRTSGAPADAEASNKVSAEKIVPPPRSTAQPSPQPAKSAGRKPKATGDTPNLKMSVAGGHLGQHLVSTITGFRWSVPADAGLYFCNDKDDTTCDAGVTQNAVTVYTNPDRLQVSLSIAQDAKVATRQVRVVSRATVLGIADFIV